MGYRVTWIAVRGKTPEKLHEEAGLKPTGAIDECAEGPICAIRLGDWYVVQFWPMNERAEDPEFLSYLSSDCELVMCSGNDGDDLLIRRMEGRPPAVVSPL